MPHAGRVRRRGVGSRRTTDEAAEQGGASLGGGGGGKGASQGEPRSASHAPDTVREHACSRGRPGCGGRICACRYYPRQEPYAVIPLVRICAGGGQQCPSLPRPFSSFRLKAWVSKAPINPRALKGRPIPQTKLHCSFSLVTRHMSLVTAFPVLFFSPLATRHSSLATALKTGGSSAP
jgi:hypothetical protein